MGCGNSKAPASAPADASQTNQGGSTLLNGPIEEKPPAGPKQEAEGPKQEAEGTKQEAEEPKQEAEEPKQEEAESPKQEAQGPKQEAESPKAEAPRSNTVKVEIIGARGLRDADLVGKSEPYCIVEIAGKPESRVETQKSTSAKEPEWNHAVEVAGYESGCSLVFTVKDSDPLRDDVLGKATATEDMVQMGYIGELPLTGAGDGVEAFLQVKVGEPGMLEQAKAAVLETLDEVQEAVDEAKEAIDDKLQETREAIDDRVQEVRTSLNEIVDQVEDTVEAVGVQIDDETKAVLCRC